MILQYYTCIILNEGCDVNLTGASIAHSFRVQLGSSGKRKATISGVFIDILQNQRPCEGLKLCCMTQTSEKTQTSMTQG